MQISMFYIFAPCLIELRYISFRQILQATTFNTWLLMLSLYSIFVKYVAITPFHSLVD